MECIGCAFVKLTLLNILKIIKLTLHLSCDINKEVQYRELFRKHVRVANTLLKLHDGVQVQNMNTPCSRMADNK